jgi:plastocyanin
MRTFVFLVVVSLAACGGDDTSSTTIDAPASTVTKLTCAGASVAATVTAPGFAFTPATSTITAGQIVKFTMPATHNAVSDSALFRADFNGDACFRFDTAGSYPFHCEPHLFTGTIVVQ